MTTAAFYALPADEQAWWVADWTISRGKCPQCGGQRTDCDDADRDWFPQRTICYQTMERDAANRRYQELHEKAPWHDGTFTSWAAEASRNFPYHRDSGVLIWVAETDLAPDDDFLTRERPSTTAAGG